MYTFQNKWAGILSQKHGKPFMLWQKRLHNDEVNFNVSFIYCIPLSIVFLSFTNEIRFFRTNYHFVICSELFFILLFVFWKWFSFFFAS